MNKCCFIIPYFGRFPQCFPLFLKTCAWNPDFNWLIITDDERVFDYPDNVTVRFMDFRSLREKIQQKFDFSVSLERAYKLCDYRPAYGYIFEEEIKGYEFWGYCDLDVIFGKLNKFITDEILQNYDKIFCLGHMTLFRNDYEINRLFMSEFKGRKLFEEVFTTDKSCNFDEEWTDNNINQIFLSKKMKVYLNDFSMNPKMTHTKFVRTIYMGAKRFPLSHGYETEDYRDALYVWDNGNVYRLYKQKGELRREDFCYMHFQHRKMKMDDSILKKNIFKIVPNSFLPIEYEYITVDNFNKIKRHILCFHYYDTRILPKLKKIRSKIH